MHIVLYSCTHKYIHMYKQHTHVQLSCDSECSHCLLFLQEFKNSLTAFLKIAVRMRALVYVYVCETRLNLRTCKNRCMYM